MLSNTSALYNVGILIGSVSDIQHHEYKVRTLSETDVEIRDTLPPNKEVQISLQEALAGNLEYKVEILGSRKKSGTMMSYDVCYLWGISSRDNIKLTGISQNRNPQKGSYCRVFPTI